MSVGTLHAQVAHSTLADLARYVEVEAKQLLAESNTPALSIAVIRAGKVSWAQAFGKANLETGALATPETYFSTASTFKLVTATAVMQLVEAGLVSLDTPVNDILRPDLTIQGADDVTIRHMLSHQSGLEGPVNIASLWGRETLLTPTEVVSQMRRSEAPGSGYRYCNECYTTLALVIERLSGLTYDAYVAQRILQPLGVNVELATVPSADVIPFIAIPYDSAGGTNVPSERIRTDAFAAGDVYLRARDMAKVLAVHLNRGMFGTVRILSEESTAEVRRRQFPSSGYGLGVELGTVDEVPVFQHAGVFPGYASYMVGDPVSGNGVYVMTNSGHSGRNIRELARNVLRAMR